MLCIASFIVFIILGIFSASYRKLASKAWYCVGKRVTFQACDINFSEEVKGRLIGKLVFTHPRLAKFIAKWIDWIAFFFVVTTIWSIFSVMNTGLNLFVYDTCDPVAPESCSLGGESCGISTAQLSFSEALETGKLQEWASAPFLGFVDTLSRVPARFQKWDARNYLPSIPTYYAPYKTDLPVAVEAIDPGCVFCQKLFKNIKDAKFYERYNLSYVVYPIPDVTTPTGTKFPHSKMIASYLESTKRVPLTASGSRVAPDWQLLEYIFLGKNGKDTDLQYQMNYVLTTDQVREKIHLILLDIGYTKEQITAIEAILNSTEIQNALEENRKIVEEKMRTLKIPTIIYGERRHDRVVDVATLSK